MNTQEYAALAGTTPEIAEQAKAVMNDLLARSVTDTTFRQKLLTEPRVALAEFTGRNVSEITADVYFVENKPGTATFVLPDAIDAQAELSSEELEAVAGGSPSSPACVASALWVVAESITLTRKLL